MKKLFILLTVSMIILATTLPTFAEETHKTTDQEITTYTYEYNGVEINSNVELEEAQLAPIYFNAINNQKTSLENSDTVGTFAENPGNSNVRVTEPYYRTYNHNNEIEAANIITAYFLRKLPKKVTDNFLLNYVVSKISGWTKPIPQYTYVGSWISSSWSSYQNKRLYWATLVHYQYSNYTSPKSIQYYEVTQWYN